MVEKSNIKSDIVKSNQIVMESLGTEEDDCVSLSDKLQRYNHDKRNSVKMNPLVTKKGHPDSMTLVSLLLDNSLMFRTQNNSPYSS
jgi:hypothetical protein